MLINKKIVLHKYDLSMRILENSRKVEDWWTPYKLDFDSTPKP